MSGLAPYRTEALAVVRPRVEWAFCPWCAHSDIGEPRYCERPATTRHPWGDRESTERCQDANPRGRCDSYQPSRLTRLLRVVGRRRPVFVEVDR